MGAIRLTTGRPYVIVHLRLGETLAPPAGPLGLAPDAFFCSLPLGEWPGALPYACEMVAPVRGTLGTGPWSLSKCSFPRKPFRRFAGHPTKWQAICALPLRFTGIRAA